MPRMNMAVLAAAALLATTLAASAQGGQTDRAGNAMGSERIGNGRPTTVTPGQPMTTTGSSRIGPNGSNAPTPQSSQGDVGPGGNNNGTLTR